MRTDNGYEYEVVGKCSRTGRPVVAPKFWNAVVKGTRVAVPRPYYPTCTCCGKKK